MKQHESTWGIDHRKRSQQAARVAELDGLRGIAIVLVLLWHYVIGQVSVAPATLPAYALRSLAFSWSGVDVFFVLSGFLVGGILIDGRAQAGATIAFLFRRACRIIPLFYVSLALFHVFVLATTGRDAGPGIAWLTRGELPWWSYVLSVQNIAMVAAGDHGPNWLGITWSLALELQLYLFLAALIHWTPSSRLLSAVLGLVVLAAVIRIAVSLTVPDDALANYILLPTRMDAALMGVAAALAIRDPIWHSRLSRVPTLLLAISVGCAVAVMLMCAFGFGNGSPAMDRLGYTLLAVGGGALLVLLSVCDDGVLHRLCRTRMLTWIGTISYGVYLLHQPIAGLLHHYLLDQAPRIASPRDALVTLSALAITLALASLSWRWLELPIIRASRRFGAKPRARRQSGHEPGHGLER